MSVAPRRWMRLAHGALAALLLTFVLEQTPHLVHHLFEDEEVPGHQTCPFASSADREPGLAPPADSLLFQLDRIGPASGLDPAHPIAGPPVRADARAPPRIAA